MFYAESTQMSPRVGFLSLCYGMLADIDIESEKFRCLGEARDRFYKASVSAEKFSSKLLVFLNR
jgi:hypothetical protein